MLKESMVEIAHKLLDEEKQEIKFSVLWEKVCEELGLSEEEKENYISRFYTQLSLDERFVLLEDNNWDLRRRHKFSEVHIDMNDVYSDIEEEEKELEEEIEEYENEEDEEDEEDDDDEDDEEYEKEEVEEEKI